MSGFSSSESECLEKKVEVQDGIIKTHVDQIDSVYELDTCLTWIQEGHFKKTCLQFPDCLLPDSVEVALRLKKRTGLEMYILGDTSYGSCCVDEVSAEHVSADSIIHFGHACLSPTNRLPVLYIFPKNAFQHDLFQAAFRNVFTDRNMNVLLLFDVSYTHCRDAVSDCLSTEYPNLVVSTLAMSQSTDDCTDLPVKFGRVYSLHEGKTEQHYHIVFIGPDGATLTNFILAFPGAPFYVFDPAHIQSIEKYQLSSNKFLMRRLYLVEKVKDAKTLGIVVGTLGVSNYLDIVTRIKKLAKLHGKKCYIFAIGKPNVPKLANFPEVEAFILIACPENTLLDCKEFYRPIVTPYEIELACCPERPWTESFVTDFRELLPGGLSHLEINEDAHKLDEDQTDVSLVTGQLRNLAPVEATCQTEEDLNVAGTVALRPDATVANISTGSEFLSSRSWQGLEQNLGRDDVKLAVAGRAGIPANYSSELDTMKGK